MKFLKVNNVLIRETTIAVTTTGLFLSFYFGSKEVSAKNENLQVNIAQVGRKLVGYGGPISVKTE